MKLDQLIPGAPALDIAGITADSRKVKPGFLFAALQGVAKDGREYIDGAIKSGAVAILTDDRAGEWSVASIRVAEPRLTLATASAAFYPTQPGVVAAVTGTNGKSSTVDFLRQIWAHMGRKAASMGTLGADRAFRRGRSWPHDAGPCGDPCNARQAGEGRRDARRDGSVEPWPLAVSSAWREAGGGSLHQPHAGPSRLSRRTSTTTAQPSCNCSPSCCRRARLQ